MKTAAVLLLIAAAACAVIGFSDGTPNFDGLSLLGAVLTLGAIGFAAVSDFRTENRR